MPANGIQIWSCNAYVKSEHLESEVQGWEVIERFLLGQGLPVNGVQALEVTYHVRDKSPPPNSACRSASPYQS
jgi:hypothetical protein